MKYIIYRYDGAIYAVPEEDEAEIYAADELTKEYEGRFIRLGKFTADVELNVSPCRKWYGFELQKEETPFLKLVKRTARNADYL